MLQISGSQPVGRVSPGGAWGGWGAQSAICFEVIKSSDQKINIKYMCSEV